MKIGAMYFKLYKQIGKVTFNNILYCLSSPLRQILDNGIKLTLKDW